MNLREIKIMAKEKGSFKEFLSAVAPEYQAFVKKLDNKLMEPVSYTHLDVYKRQG